MTPPDESSFWQHLANWLWLAILPLLRWIWTRAEKDMQETRDDLDQLRNKVVTVEQFRDRNDAVDKLLEDRRLGERDLHKSMEGIRKDLNEGLNGIKDLIIARLPK